MSPRRIIVSIDFGTTYSGLAWAETSRAGSQYLIDTWPTQTSNKTSPKVPTELRSIANGYQWGFQIPTSAKRSRNFKLKLDDPTSSSTTAQSPADLTQLYFSYLYEHLKATLVAKLSASVFESTPIDFILTVPAIWSLAAKQKTETAATRAGFKGSKKIHLVSEPEAAAIYTLSNLGAPNMAVGQTFVVCDAGGGTVDLISYKIEQVSPRLVVKEATSGTGGKCGSALLNQRFRRYLKQALGDRYWTDDRLVEAVNRFDDFKKTFTLNGEPLSIVVDLPNDPARNIRRNRFRISQADMEKEVFAPIVNDVIDLVREQIRMVRERARTTGGNVTAVLLVGGFGSSEYLKNRIKASIDRAIIVQQPANGWTAVVRGAAMIGLSRANSELGRVHVSERVARKHYGTELNKVFVEGEDDASKKFWDAKEERYMISHMEWFVTKGQSYPVGRPAVIQCCIDFPVRSGEAAPTRAAIYENSVDRRPPRYRNSNTIKVAQLDVDVERVGLRQRLFKSDKRRIGGHWYYQFDAYIEATYESASIGYALKLRDKLHDVVTVNIDR